MMNGGDALYLCIGTWQGHEGKYVGGFENGLKHGHGEMTYVV
jgi:hypothetical protein